MVWFSNRLQQTDDLSWNPIDGFICRITAQQMQYAKTPELSVFPRFISTASSEGDTEPVARFARLVKNRSCTVPALASNKFIKDATFALMLPE